MSVGNTKYGDGALQKNINGSNNTAFGICSSRDTDVSWNTSLGAYANMSNVSGISNVAVGTNANLLDVSGSYNTALGTATLLNNKANSNTAVGSNAMENNIDGKENVAIGVQAGYENTTGQKNVFVGSYAGFNNLDGSENIFLGNNSGNNPSSNFSFGSKNSFLGANTGVANINKEYDNSTAIGYGSIIDASNQIMLGTINDNVILPGNAYLTNLSTNYTEQSVVSKKYVDTYVSGGIQITKICDLATTEDISLSGQYIPSYVDNYPLSNGMRVLVRCQDSSNNISISNVNNGIYDYYSSPPEFVRAADCSGNNVKGQATFIKDGSYNKSYIFVQTNYDGFNQAIAGVYPLQYDEFQKLEFSIGNGLQIVGNTLQVKPDITNTAGDPYLTDIGILGSLNVGGDSSFNSRVDVYNIISQPGTSSSTNYITQNIISGDINSNPNNLKYTNIVYNVDPSISGTSQPVLNLRDTNSGNSIFFLPNSGGGSYNLLSSKNNQSIFSRGITVDNANFVLSTWSTLKNGIKMSANSSTNAQTELWAGNDTSIILNNSTGVSINGTLNATKNIKVNNVVVGTTSGSNSTIVGNSTGTTGNNDVFIGHQSGFSNTTGSSNNFIGYQCGYKNTTGSSNNFIGNQCGYNNTTGSSNNFIGYQCGYNNTTGIDNNFIGYQCGYNNTTGSSNNFIGNQSGYNNTTGGGNVFVGIQSGNKNTTGSSNNFIGLQCGYKNTTGSSNNFIGNLCGYNNTTGVGNVFVGLECGYSNTTGNYNLFIGYNTARKIITGSNNIILGFDNFYASSSITMADNVAIGNNSGYANNGNYNTFLGNSTGYNTDGNYNTLVGYYAGRNSSACTDSLGNTLLGSYSTIGANNVQYSTAIGYGALIDSSNTIVLGRNIETTKIPGKLNVSLDSSFNSKIDISGTLNVINSDAYIRNIRIGYGSGNISTNTVVGMYSGISNTTGYTNTFVGYKSGYSNTNAQGNSYFGYASGEYSTGIENTFIGSLSGGSNNGSYNVALGYNSGVGNISFSASNCVTIGHYAGAKNLGNNNVFIGKDSAFNNTTGNSNTFVGKDSGIFNTTGFRNVCIGYLSGDNLKTGSYNTLLGTESKSNNDNIQYSTAIGYGATVNTNNTIVIGRTSETTQIPGKLIVEGDVSMNSKLNVTSNSSFNSNINVSGNLSVGGSVKYSTTYHTNSLTLNNNSTYSNTFNVSTSPSCTFPLADSSNVGIQFLITNVNSSSLTIYTTSSQPIYSSTAPSSSTTRTLSQYNSQIFTSIQIGTSSYGWSMV